MQIQLKQPEIVAALRRYIADQGIRLEGKEVSISFTAGRKESGLSADVSIEDPSLRDDTTLVTQAPAEAPAPATTRVKKTEAPAPVAEPKVEDSVKVVDDVTIAKTEAPAKPAAVKRPPWEADEPVKQTPAVEEAVTEAAPPAPAAKTSLFG